MPKEIVYTSRYPKDDNFNIEVGWTRDLHVQIGIREPNDRSVWWRYSDNYREEIGAEIRKIVVPEQGTSAFNEPDLTDLEIGEAVMRLLDTICGSCESLWATIDRKDINDLIRILRRARDSAFGKDE